MRIRQKIFLTGILLVLLAACTRPLKEITYVHGIETGIVHADSLTPTTYRIRPNDHLYILILGDNPENTDFLNITQSGQGNGSQNLELITYIVNEKGYISFPQLGEVYVKDKTLLQVQEEMAQKITAYMDGIFVHIKLVYLTITVLGEVNSPGLKRISKTQVTIFEALGTAGDINDWGNRKTVKLFRQTEIGKEIVSIDLTDPQLINTPYYYILPNDVIYVEASSRVFGFKTLNFVSIFTVALSLITTILVIATFFQ